MEVKILEEKKNKIIFRIKGAGHTLCNALRDQLNQDSNVKAVGYQIDHPQMGVPEFLVETGAGVEAKKVVLDAVKKLRKETDSLKKQADKLK